MSADGAYEHLNALGRRYKGIDDYADNYRGADERVIMRVEPGRMISPAP